MGAGAASEPNPPGLAEAMREPSFYPHRPAAVEVVETHISLVFLAGELVYKVKKAVVLPFLDYGTRERRRHLCHEEVRLNRRLAPSLYLGVRAIVPGASGGYALAPEGPEALESCVEMRRIAAADLLSARLEGGTATATDLRAVGERLARFHAAAEEVKGLDGAELTLSLWEAVLATLRGQRPGPGERAAIAAAERFARAFVAGRAEELRERARAGRVREGHGDLRAEHVVLADGVEAFDCIEFDPGLRRMDVAADVAFLVMDLTGRGEAGAAGALLAAYREAGGNPGDDALVSFWAAQRAWVRAAVAHVRAGELESPAERGAAKAEAARLAGLARRFAFGAHGPLVLAVCGGPGTGKSTLARELAERSGLELLSSDVVRKGLAGLAPTERGEPGLYDAEMDRRTYAELGRLARAAVERSGGAIVDATMRRADERGAFAAGLGASPVVNVLCTAPEALVRERALRRERDPARISDADAALALRLAREFEPLAPERPEDLVELRTDRPPEELADAVEEALDRRLAASGR